MKSEDYDKLKPEEVRIIIAELRGWVAVDRAVRGIYMEDKDGVEDIIPDYLNDLNACHEFEDGMTGAQQVIYGDWLGWIAQKTEKPLRWTWNATAAQRCRAFVLTMTRGE